jgi:phenylalanyl-tRNA synthetase beta chain
MIYGNTYPEQWGICNKSADFYDMKSDLEAVLALTLDLPELQYEPVSHPALHTGQSARIMYKNQSIGLIGGLHPAIMKQMELTRAVFMFELELGYLTARKALKYMKISKYPSIRRDISIIITEDIQVADVMKCVKNAASDLVNNLELFDVYRGEGIDSGKKSLALGLTFQKSSSTLTDEEADIAVGNVLDALYQRFGAILRE